MYAYFILPLPSFKQAFKKWSSSGVLVFYCCRNELPQTWWFRTKQFFILESGGQKSKISLTGLKSQCCQGWLLLSSHIWLLTLTFLPHLVRTMWFTGPIQIMEKMLLCWAMYSQVEDIKTWTSLGPWVSLSQQAWALMMDRESPGNELVLFRSLNNTYIWQFFAKMHWKQ